VTGSGLKARRSQWRLSLVLLLAGAAAVAGLGLTWMRSGGGAAALSGGGGAATQARTVHPPAGRAVAWEGVRLEPGEPERLTLYFIGGPDGAPVAPCSPAYEAIANPSGGVMTATVYELPSPTLPPGHGCAAIGYARSLTVELPEPLLGRPVVDGATGERRMVIDARTLLAPTYLPAGYRSVSDRVEGDIHRRTWAPDGRPDRQPWLTVSLGALRVAQPYQPVVLAKPTIRGAPATVSKTKGFDDGICATWVEGTTGHSVCTSGTPGELLPIEELVRVADGLR
jgi:hypothetical protein